MLESTKVDSTPPEISHPVNPEEDDTAMNNNSASSTANPAEIKDEKDKTEATTTTITVPPELISSLSSQLEYYFSPTNLRRDTYLRTIMGLNSGYVPTTVLATFANVNRIIAQHDTDGSLLSSPAGLDVPSLIQKAVLQGSQVLDVVVLDMQGTMMARWKDYQAPEINPPITLVAVGPASDSDELQLEKLRRLKENNDTASNDPRLQSSAIQEILPSFDTVVEKQLNTIILRDMPDSIGSDQIYEIFKKLLPEEDGATVKDIRSEVGNCWFVTLEHQTKEELVSLLFAFRDEKLPNGEPIKARLKTESTVKTFYAALPNSSTERRGDFRPRGAYVGDRYSPSKVSSRVSSSTTDGTSYRRPFPGGGRTFGGRGNAGRGAGAGKSSWSNPSSASNKTAKDPTPSIPPPPLVEEHFPTLAGKEEKTDPVAERSPTNTDHPNDDKDTNKEPKKETTTATILPKPISLPSLPTGGYAAALLKAASPQIVPQVKSFNKVNNHKNTSHASKTQPKPTFGRKAESASKQGGSGNSTKSASTASTGVSTDDCSTDEKSSPSSAHESEKVTSATKPVSAWGGGRSFAEVVKKPQAAPPSVKGIQKVTASK